jgi:hypothetical protein
LEKVDIFHGLLEYFTVIWDILPFATFCVHLVHFVYIWYIFPVLVSCTKKNLATLHISILKCRKNAEEVNKKACHEHLLMLTLK